MSLQRALSTPPPEEPLMQTTIKYEKKARHGHKHDVTDIYNIRQVAGCLPIDPISKRFLLISSSKNPEAWVIPKGGWEMDETQEQAALRETWEEAGLKGRITHQLGIFVERSKKRIKAHHWIFEMEIDEICKKYPERRKRDRRWFTFDEALLATQNNYYIQEAIRLSSISPEQQKLTTPRSSFDGKHMKWSSPILSPIINSYLPINTTPPSSVPTTPVNQSIIESPSTQNSRKSMDAFQALKELMENASISA
ncbi:NUDIX hydrolase domain-like protein [Cokeromyces recurvatus]|uniref:NUDIX hydrolase domain-like protein n=1 Tax=Cokeromyces recurvatus TaxID=90255 RepID=UPI00221FFB07|nr:NUDIX hydrolase domain-like protein [Cokeromyces recurvatus]KAI7906072.1 NUDIX hydrolase domain-like protein [Cokeromyces recurvatus]